jgi:citrate/tricarballylate utilization protein
MRNPAINEASRQVTICNACRYCEGFCSVFPALQEHRVFTNADITQLANLCHNCRACHYACQYSSPHEFNINIPQALSQVRVDSWERYSWPRPVAAALQRHGTLIGLALVIALSLFFVLLDSDGGSKVGSFYDYLSHQKMVWLFTPVFVLPLFSVALALRRYWHDVGGDTVRWGHLRHALCQALHLNNLAGGQGQGCNFERSDRYSNTRRWAHQCAVAGFLLCFASTTSGTFMHYLFNMPAPYSWYAVPKLLGVPGGVLLTVGCAALAVLKLRADRKLGAPHVWGAEMAFVLLLGLTGLSGLVLYATTGTTLVRPALAIHLAFVFVLFLILPYSKMVHGFFRLAALIKDAQSPRFR